MNKEAINSNGKTFVKSSGVGDGLLVPNRIILTVTEDLGGGLKARFVNEHGISPTSTDDWGIRVNNGAPQVAGAAASTASQIPGSGWSTGSTNRGSFLAVNGGFGEVRAGYLVSSFYNASSQSGYLLGGEQYGALLHTLGLGDLGGARANGLQYISPAMAGFNLDLQQQSGAERQATSAEGQAYTTNEAPRTAIRLNYANGPFAATFVNTAYKPLTVNAPAVATVDGSNTANQLLASYTMGAFKFTMSNNDIKLDDKTATNADKKMKSTTYGVQYTSGAWTGYYVGGKGTVDNNTAASGARINDIKQQQIGVKYALSKRTTAYFVTGESKDSAIAAGATNIAKGKVNGLGLTHAF
jgi:major outer membrane protein P.IB